MTAAPFEHASDASAALREIVADHGVDGLSRPALVARLLSDLLPDAPGVARILTAAAEQRVAETLLDHEAQGMDAATAADLTAVSFATATMFTPEVCAWVVDEFAAAAGLPSAGAQPGRDDQPHVTIPPAPASAGRGGAAAPASAFAVSVPDRAAEGETRTLLATSAPDPAGAPPGSGQAGPADATARSGAAIQPTATVGEPLAGQAPVSDGEPAALQPTATVSEPLAGQAAATIGRRLAGRPAPGPRAIRWAAVAAAVLVVVGGMVIWRPWSSSALAQPGGLLAGGVSANSVTLSWAKSATGRAPSTYLVLLNGTRVGSVPGGVSVDDITGLDPATTYRFQVVAVSGSQRSAPSRAVTATTATPPLSAAALTGEWVVNQQITKSHYEPAAYRTGRSQANTWDFTPLCASRSCAVSFAYHDGGLEIDGTLHHAGLTYSGTVQTRELLDCGKIPETSTLKVNIAITQAGATGQDWTAVSWSGTLDVHDVGGGCGESWWTAILNPVQS